MLSQIKFSKKWQKNLEITSKHYNFALAFKEHRDVAQSGLEYSSGGRVVASSNLVIPTKRKALKIKHLARFSKLFLLPLAPTFHKSFSRVQPNLSRISTNEWKSSRKIKNFWQNICTIQKKSLPLHRFSRETPHERGWKKQESFTSHSKSIWALSSAGSERLPYKQRVGGSNPSAPTQS